MNVYLLNDLLGLCRHVCARGLSAMAFVASTLAI